MSGSFELKFFHPPEQVVGKDGKNVTKRRCRFCGTLASEHNERRRNHLKDADDGCDRNFKLANGGLSFKEYVIPQPRRACTTSRLGASAAKPRLAPTPSVASMKSIAAVLP